jgi:hypothetical protein
MDHNDTSSQLPSEGSDGINGCNSVSISFERYIVDPASPASHKFVGTAILDDGRKPKSNKAEAFEAVILSEAQYFGHEKKIDVLGYPLYNIMIVKRRPDDGVLERLGLGKIYKSAWRRASPRSEVVVLE